jgi:transitional endoplasmic reticulum ATPase
MIARAVASEVEAHFIPVNGPELLSKWYGQSEENLRELFYEARDLAPSVIFFDEFDSICQARSSRSDAGYEAKLVNQLLTMMDGVEDYSRITVIAATNRKDILDPAVMRPGRFDYSIEVPLPDDEGLRKILEISMKNLPVSGDVDLESIASKMKGFSGAEIAFCTREAAYNSMRRNVDFTSALLEADLESYDYEVSQDDFLRAIEKAAGQK